MGLKFSLLSSVVETTPTIDSVSPLYGPEAGGTRMTLMGSYLVKWSNTTVITLLFGDEEVKCEKESQ